MTVHVFGIRHHGPGCARSLVQALVALQPDAVLIEGPPDAEDLLNAASDPGMVPPVALLIHAVEDPSRAVFYPFAVFSPEWQAIQYGLEHKLPVRFIDLPQAIRLASPRHDAEEDADDETREDPLGLLAEAAGLSDRELWWEREIEARRDATGMFAGILEAMTALRDSSTNDSDELEQRREAHMRQCIRAAQKEGFERIAVVCGAWHAPVLARPGPARADAERLRGLAKVKVASSWIPWTASRLCLRTGYGAGVTSPGWYGHLWAHPERATIQWAARAARLLRDEDLEASSANVIETVRLADALAAMRSLAAPGLGELTDAVQAVLCQGQPAPLALIRERLEIGGDMGAVPDNLATVPLLRELEREQRRLRMKVAAEPIDLELDLRKELDRERSRLLRRLDLLAVPWGTLVAGSAMTGTGTFRESWRTKWQPEMVVALIEASIHGNTLVTAAVGRSLTTAAAADVASLARLLDAAVLAELGDAIDGLLSHLQARSALSADVQTLLTALPPLVRICRYGDVRGTQVERVRPVLTGLFERAVIGLPQACTQLADEAAAALAETVDATHEAVLVLDDSALRDEWLQVLLTQIERDAVHPLLRGRFCRRLVQQQRLDEPALARLASLALSRAVEPAQAAAWLEGLVSGSAVLLLHQDGMWQALDDWLSELSTDAFAAVLPLVRRAFSGFSAGERRQMGARVVRGRAAPTSPAPAATVALDRARAALTLPVLAHILGGSREQG